MIKGLKVGVVIKSSTGQYAKVVSEQNSVYGLSDWTNLEGAKRANVANRYININGLRYAGVTVVTSKSDTPSTEKEPTTGSKEVKETKDAKPKAKAAPKKTAKAKAK